MFQGADRLPFSASSADVNSPLHQFLVDTHFSDGNRMGRLVAFTAFNPPKIGLGIDA